MKSRDSPDASMSVAARITGLFVSSPTSQPTGDDRHRRTQLRFLVPKRNIDNVIGENGKMASEFETESATIIQWSRTNECFPGTEDRIIMVSGLLDRVVAAMGLLIDQSFIIDQCLGEEDLSKVDDSICIVRIIVPNISWGLIAGPGEETIRMFMKQSGADIEISPEDDHHDGLHDRLVSVRGTFDAILLAIELILDKLSEDDKYNANLRTPYTYGGFTSAGRYMIPQRSFNTTPSTPVVSPNQLSHTKSIGVSDTKFGGVVGYGRRSIDQTHQLSKPNELSQTHTIGISNAKIGAVIGHGGSNLSHIIEKTGANITVSDRNDLIPGTSNRKVTISGSQEAVQTAATMIEQILRGRHTYGREPNSSGRW